VENQKLGALLDPFGGAALDLATRYWTVAEKNQAVPGFAGPLLWNRVLWSGIGFVILAVAIATFRTGATSAGRSGRPSRLGRLFARRGKAPLREVEAGAPVAGVSPLPAARLDFSPRARRALF